MTGMFDEAGEVFELEDSQQAATRKELRHLSRLELIDIIYELQKRNVAAEARINQLQFALNEKQLRINNAGSIAQAALDLQGVFEAAQAAADQYLVSIQAREAEAKAKLDDAERQHDVIVAQAQREALDLIHDVRTKLLGALENETP